MSEKLFLLGLGYQKCGTSWLHSYLQQSANFDGGLTKEYHVWDVRDIPMQRHNRVSWKQGLLGNSKQRRRFRMQRHSQSYFEYFDGLYRDGVTVSADITPAYSGLDIARLEFIRDRFANMDVTVRAIILIREPIGRIKSAVRFNLDREKYYEGLNFGETDFTTALGNYYESAHCRMRTSYQSGILNALNVFGENDLHVGIYESMFESREIERLSRFCGIQPRPEVSEIRVNKTVGKTEQNPDLDAKMREAYRDTYSFCFERYPETQLLWS